MEKDACMHRQSSTHAPCFDYTLTRTTVTFPILTGRHEGRLLLLTLRQPQVSTIPRGNLHKEAGTLVSLDCSDEKQEFSRQPESVNLLWFSCQHTDVNAAIPSSSHYMTAFAVITSLCVAHGSQPTMEYMCLAVCAFQKDFICSEVSGNLYIKSDCGHPRKDAGRMAQSEKCFKPEDWN